MSKEGMKNGITHMNCGKKMAIALAIFYRSVFPV